MRLGSKKLEIHKTPQITYKPKTKLFQPAHSKIFYEKCWKLLVAQL